MRDLEFRPHPHYLGCMPRQVLFTLLIQLALVSLTLLLLLQPKRVFRGQSVKVRGFAWGTGWVVFGLMFCWSMIAGCVLVLNGVNVPFGKLLWASWAS